MKENSALISSRRLGNSLHLVFEGLVDYEELAYIRFARLKKLLTLIRHVTSMCLGLSPFFWNVSASFFRVFLEQSRCFSTKEMTFFLWSILSKNRLKVLMVFSAMTLLHSFFRCGVVGMFSTFRSSFVILLVGYGFASAILPEFPTTLATVTMYLLLRRL